MVTAVKLVSSSSTQKIQKTSMQDQTKGLINNSVDFPDKKLSLCLETMSVRIQSLNTTVNRKRIRKRRIE